MIGASKSDRESDKALRALFSSDDLRYIQMLYHLFLGRQVDADGRQSYLKKLRSGYGRSGVLADVASSREANEKQRAIPVALKNVLDRKLHPFIMDELLRLENVPFLRLAYRTILDREPDDEGMQIYLNALSTGQSRLKVLKRLRRSAEGANINAHLPEIDNAIKGGFVDAFPILRSLFRSSHVGKQGLLMSLQRIESSLFEFRGSPLAERIASKIGLDNDISPSQWQGEARVSFNNSSLASTPIVGNVAVPAKAMSGEITIKRILLLKLDHIGDFFVTVRPMVMLREAWPDAHITLVCGPWNVNLAKQLGIFDDVRSYHFFNAKTGDEKFDWEAKDWAARCDGIKELNLGTFDLAVDLRHDSDTRPILTRIDAKLRAGFASPGGAFPATPPLDLFLLEIPADFRDQLHAETRLVALASLVVEALRAPPIHPIRRLIASNVSANHLLFDGRPYIVVAPGAGSPNRTWPAENFIMLMEKAVSEWQVSLVLIGPSSEAEVNSRIKSHFPDDICVDLTGGSLTDLPTLIDRALLFIGNDTGGGHLAALAGTPTLSIYAGVSDPRVWQPLGQSVSIVHSRTPCSYCHINLRKDCRHELRCLSEITVPMAWTEMERLYGRDQVRTGQMASLSTEVPA